MIGAPESTAAPQIDALDALYEQRRGGVDKTIVSQSARTRARERAAVFPTTDAGAGEAVRPQAGHAVLRDAGSVEGRRLARRPLVVNAIGSGVIFSGLSA